MVRHLTPLLLLLGIPLFVQADETEASATFKAAKIARTQTYGDLLTQQEIKTGRWTVRLGIGENSEPSPWRVIYCLAETDDAEPIQFKGKLKGERLGPLSVDVKSPDAPTVAEIAEAYKGVTTKRSLFAKVITTAWKGDYLVTVRGVDGEVVAQQTITIPNDSPCYWHPLIDEPRKLQKVERPQGTIARKAIAAIPAIRGSAPFDTQEAQHEEPLPGLQADNEHAELKLSLSKSVLVIKSDHEMIDWAERHLLVRWWVNGKPVIPTREEQFKLHQVGRKVTYTNQFQVRIKPRKYLGELKPDDRITAQVVYCSAFFEYLPKHRASDLFKMMAAAAEDKDLLLFSNRITFESSDVFGD